MASFNKLIFYLIFWIYISWIILKIYFWDIKKNKNNDANDYRLIIYINNSSSLLLDKIKIKKDRIITKNDINQLKNNYDERIVFNLED